MKKFSLRLISVLLSTAMLSSCFTAPSEGAEATELPPLTTVSPIDPETGEPIRILPAETAVLSLEPQSVSGNYVKTNSTFRVKTREDLDESELSSLLTVQPARELHVTKNASCDYTLDCGALPKGEIVKIMLGDGRGNTVNSWGFQTEDEFRVLSVLPANLSTNVFSQTGIEISLSAPPDLTKVSDYFEITPSVGGKFTNYSTTLVYIPSESLKKNTVYTVRVKAGLPSADGAALAEDTVFSFRTQEGTDTDFCRAMNGISESYLPGDPVVIDIMSSESFLGREFELKLYRYPDIAAYRRSIEAYNAGTDWDGEYILPTEGLSTVIDAKTTLQHSEKPGENYVSYYYGYGKKSAFVLPNDLEEGWYLADLVTELDDVEYRIQRLIQISPLSVYAAVFSGQAMFFLNDSETGDPAKNAEISLTVDKNEFTGKTNADGIAVFDYSTDKDHYGVLEIRYGDRIFCDRMTCVSDRELTPREKYYMYLFTDREAYLTTDTVRFWGVIVPRSEEMSPPSELTVKLGNTNNDGFSTAVSVSADGTFTGEIHYERYADCWWEPLTMFDGETKLFSASVQIRDYEKPTYLLEPVLPEMVWIPQENGITAGARVSYYDGTPAVGKTVMIDSKISDVPTDENGYTERTVRNGTDFSRSPSRPWENCTIEYRLDGIEDQYQYKWGSTVAFTRDIGLDIEETQAENGTTSLALNAYHVDFGENIQIDSSPYYSAPIKETYMGAPADLTVTAKVQRNWYVKTETGSYYDYIQKKQITTYQYGEKSEIVGTYTAEVRNGVGAFEDLPTTDPKSSYRITLTWEDSAGRLMSNEFYVGNTSYPRDTDLITYRLTYKEEYEWPYLAEIGETRKLWLKENYAEIPDADFTGRIFYAVHQDRALLLGVSDRNEFTVTMREEYVPNIDVIAAYFDGKHVYAAEGSITIQFNSKGREIELGIETDQPSYAPAETAEVRLTAKTTDGKPIPNARVLLSVVDEAAFAIAQQRADPLESLYRYIYYPDAVLYASYIQHTMDNPNTGGDGGGADEGSIRKKFVDTAFFTEGITDANGTLTLSVALPDNVTSWRFTAVAAAKYDGGRLYAGTERLNVSATLPVFVTPIMVTEYAEGDDVVFSAGCAGDPNAKITAQVDGDGFSKTLDADADGEFDFGKLPIGEYTVLFRAESDLGSDAAEYPFRVVGARLTSRIEREFDLGETIDISPAAWPVTLNFYNQDVALYAEILNTLLCTNGTNLDYRLAREYAAVERGGNKAEVFSQTVHAETANGIASLYKYTERDFELTALLCAAFPNDVDRTAVQYSLRECLAYHYFETQDEAVSCYLGLAALDTPVLNEVRRLLEENTALSGGEKLKLCAAIALLGDRDTALKYYLEITENLVLYQKDGEVFAYYSESNSENSNEIQGDTRLALLAASVLNLPEAESMARWINRQKHRVYGCALERVVFLEHYKPALTLSATLGYTADGEEKTEKIDNFFGISLAFGEEQFKNADFKALSGNIGCTAVYEGKSDELSGTPTLTVTKTVTLEEGSEAGKPGAVYRVELSVEGEGKYFTIEDMIPSNARFLYAQNLFDGEGRYVSVSNDDGRQDVTISLSNVHRATYYIRQVTKGETVLEGAVAYNSEGGYGVAEKDIFNKN